MSKEESNPMNNFAIFTKRTGQGKSKDRARKEQEQGETRQSRSEARARKEQEQGETR